MDLIKKFIDRWLPFITLVQPEPPYVFEGIKVGDRFKSTSAYNYAMEGVITVTELTEKGFKYTVEKPYHCFPARYGPSLVEGGELLINSVNHPRELWNQLYEKVL